MKIAFHSEQLGLRGTEVAMYDYAHYNEEILGNESIIISNENERMESREKFESRFPVFLYKGFNEVAGIVEKNSADALYMIKGGWSDNKFLHEVPTLFHAVFWYHEPHGDRWAYVSDWLAKYMEKQTGHHFDAVPHMVTLNAEGHPDYREHLGISKDAMVYGYYGGEGMFQLDLAKQAIRDIVQKRNDIYFVFMNIDKFVDHPQVMFMAGSTDLNVKSSFINTCDACIHARSGGETFGLVSAEFSLNNKPVLCWSGVTEKAHLDILGDKVVMYHDYKSLYEILDNFSKADIKDRDWNAYRDYNPEAIMRRFDGVFLNNL